MRFSVPKRRQPPAVIIVSLIDILIVLLIFLMVTTTFKDTPALRITLPESNREGDTKPGVSETPPLIVTITTNPPHFYLGKSPVTLDRLQAELVGKAKANPNLILAIRADTKAAYGDVVGVTDIASKARIKQIKAYVRPGIRP